MAYKEAASPLGMNASRPAAAAIKWIDSVPRSDDVFLIVQKPPFLNIVYVHFGYVCRSSHANDLGDDVETHAICCCSQELRPFFENPLPLFISRNKQELVVSMPEPHSGVSETAHDPWFHVVGWHNERLEPEPLI